MKRLPRAGLDGGGEGLGLLSPNGQYHAPSNPMATTAMIIKNFRKNMADSFLNP